VTVSTIRFVCAALITALVVPLLVGGIQINIISMHNGHGPSIGAFMMEAFSDFPLALVAAPLNAIGATIMGAFSLGAERLIGRRSVLIWLVHGLAMGLLSLLLFSPHNHSSLIVCSALGSWPLGSLLMRWVLSGGSQEQMESSAI
jgi:hypothetical protein